MCGATLPTKDRYIRDNNEKVEDRNNLKKMTPLNYYNILKYFLIFLGMRINLYVVIHFI